MYSCYTMKKNILWHRLNQIYDVLFLQLSLEDIIDNADVYNEHSKGAKFANLKVCTHTNLQIGFIVIVSYSNVSNLIEK